MSEGKFKLIVLGGGAGGISIAARMKKHIPAESIAILDSAEKHYYQPWWSLVGAGYGKKEDSVRDMSTIIPKGVNWIKEKAISIDPKAQEVTTKSGKYKYDFLIVATGLKYDFNKIKGLEGNLGKNGICTIYQWDQLDNATNMITNFQGGTMIFTMPPTPIRCAGAPQKIMYLTDDVLRHKGVRDKSKIIWASTSKAIFGVTEFQKSLTEIVNQKGIITHFCHRLIEVDPVNKVATFEVGHDKTENGQLVTTYTNEKYNFDLLHVVPPMSAHDFIANSPLAFQDGPQKGWLKVDQYTLQHLDYPNIFGIGDVIGVPNSKTGAAIRKEAPIVEENLWAVMNGKKPEAQYNGYASCPLVVGEGKVILAEFGYDGKLLPTFPIDPTKPRRSMWFLKTKILPHVYWRGMLKGWL